MSLTGVSFHRRNYSGELDVFEAATYFSSFNETISLNAATNFATKIIKENNLIPQELDNENHDQEVEEKQIKEKKFPKTPNSPGGKIANFFNSIFNQSNSKKKKSKSLKEEESRRKRRSSISDFQSSTTTTDSRSIYSSSSSSESRTAISKIGFLSKPIEKNKILGNGYVEKERNLVGKVIFRKFDAEMDDGFESDSSSDLFELQNYELSSGLPVYGSTKIESIQRGISISNSSF